MLTQHQSTLYRTLRREGWRAKEALRHVREDAALDAAERDYLIQFVWEWDNDYRPEDMTDIPELAAEEVEKLSNGQWEVQGCIAEVPNFPPIVFTGTRSEGWTPKASLWGIVGPFDRTDYHYRRSVEIDLAYEVGILGQEGTGK